MQCSHTKANSESPPQMTNEASPLETWTNKACAWPSYAVDRCSPLSKLAKWWGGRRTNFYHVPSTKPNKSGNMMKPAINHSSYGVLPCSYGPNSPSAAAGGPGRGQGIL